MSPISLSNGHIETKIPSVSSLQTKKTDLKDPPKALITDGFRTSFIQDTILLVPLLGLDAIDFLQELKQRM